MNSKVKTLIRNYLESRNGLKELGVLRSERNLQGDHAEWLVAQRLQLTLAESGVQKGFDGTDKEGITYQIKSRIVDSIDSSTSFDIQEISHMFDYLICVFFNTKLEVLQMIKLPRKLVVELVVKNSKNYRLRWNKEMMKNPNFEVI